MPTVARSCRLCDKESELRLSHIIPDFFGRGGGDHYPTGENGQLQPFTQPVHTTPGMRCERKQKGLWERKSGQIQYLLCHDCEQRLSGWEDYVKKFFYGKSHPIQIKLPLKADPFFSANYRKMKLFQISLLWRAGVATGDFFSKVELSGKHAEELRQMLLNNNPGPEDRFPCGLARLVLSPQIDAFVAKHNGVLEAFQFAPVGHHFDNRSFFSFIMGGLSWTFCVSDSGIPDLMRNTYIKENGQFFLSNLNADRFLTEFGQKVVQSGNLTWEDVVANRNAKQHGI